MAEKTYTCECGKIFNDPQKFNGHKAHCKAHHLFKYGNLDVLHEHDRKCTLHSNVTAAIMHEKALKEKQNCLDQWISEQHRCEKCGKIMTTKYGSGRFCSRACSNSRRLTEETKQRISNSCRKSTDSSTIHPKTMLHLQYLEDYNRDPKCCVICGKILSYEQRNNKMCSRKCRDEYNSIHHPNYFKKIIYGKNIPGRHIVYKVTNDFDDRYYIGVRKTDNDATDPYLGSGVIITKMVKKYGKEHFKRETLFEYQCSADAFEKEKELLKEALLDKNCVNIAEGGQGGYIRS